MMLAAETRPLFHSAAAPGSVVDPRSIFHDDGYQAAMQRQLEKEEFMDRRLKEDHDHLATLEVRTPVIMEEPDGYPMGYLGAPVGGGAYPAAGALAAAGLAAQQHSRDHHQHQHHHAQHPQHPQHMLQHLQHQHPQQQQEPPRPQPQLAPAEPPPPPSVPVATPRHGEFVVTKDRGVGEGRRKVGMEVVPQRNTSLKVNRVNDGVVADWNRENPASEVKPGYTIMEVNGVRGDAPAMLEQIKSARVLSMCVRKPAQQ